MFATTIVYKDSSNGNVMTPFGVLLALLFLDTRVRLPQLWQSSESLNTFYTVRNIFKRKKIVNKHAIDIIG